MILSDRDISRELMSPTSGFEIEGVNYAAIGPASVDVYLGDSFWMLGEPEPRVLWDGASGELPPGGFVLGTTREIVTLPDNIMGQVHGCSSIGRTGLFVQNAGLIDPGFSGQITLELFNASEFMMYLKVGQRIAQLSFQYLNSPAQRPYGMRGRYQNQRGATAARPPRS